MAWRAWACWMTRSGASWAACASALVAARARAGAARRRASPRASRDDRRAAIEERRPVVARAGGRDARAAVALPARAGYGGPGRDRVPAAGGPGRRAGRGRPGRRAGRRGAGRTGAAGLAVARAAGGPGAAGVVAGVDGLRAPARARRPRECDPGGRAGQGAGVARLVAG